MSVAVFSAVLATALFHAGWNFAVKKSSGNKIAVIWLGQLLAGLVVLPIALLCTDFSLFSTSWLKFIVATGVIHSVYIALLGWSYTVGDISVVYPVARGVGILGTSLIAILFGIDQVSHLGIAGILLIVLGIVFIGLKEIPHAARRVALGIAIAVGLTITCYSLVDKLATKEIPPLFYATVLNISSALFCAPLIFLKYS